MEKTEENCGITETEQSERSYEIDFVDGIRYTFKYNRSNRNLEEFETLLEALPANGGLTYEESRKETVEGMISYYLRTPEGTTSSFWRTGDFYGFDKPSPGTTTQTIIDDSKAKLVLTNNGDDENDVLNIKTSGLTI